MTPEEIRRPPLRALLAHLDAYGPEGIMESATHLSEADLVTLDTACKRASKAARFPKRRKRRKRRIGKGRR